NLGLNLVYNHKFRKRGRNFSGNINLGTNSRDSESETLNFTRNLNLPVPVEITLRQLILQENNNQNFGARFNFSEPILKDRYLDLIYSYNYSYAKNDRQTYTHLPNGNLELSPQLTNAFENTFVTQRVGANIRTVKKKYNYTVGIIVQPVILNGFSITKDSTYTPQKRVNIFPVARLAYNFSRTKTLNFNYNGNARQPSFTQLQPVRDISNPQYQTQGNPGLKPELNHNFSLFFNNFNFTSGKVFFVGTNVNVVKNKIANNSIPLGNSGAQLTIPENVDGYFNATGFYTFSKPFQNRKYVFSLNGTINYNHNVTLIDSVRNVGNNILVSQGAALEFNYKEFFEMDGGVRYSLNSARYSLTDQQNLDFSSWAFTTNSRLDLKDGWVFRYDFEYTFNDGLAADVNQNLAILNASLEKTIFKKKNGFLRLSAYDIFKQNTNISRTVSGNFITDTRTNRLTRYIMLTFT
ncbi:MAG: outer membrane beta-barrel protein, partial [Chitinophagaceae bacterium]